MTAADSRILFVTLRAHALDIDRRLRALANLGEDVRHFPLAQGDFVEFRGRPTAFQVVRRAWFLLLGMFRLRRALKTFGRKDIVLVNGLDALAVSRAARLLARNRSLLACQILDVHYYLVEPGPFRSISGRIERRLLRGIDLLIVPTEGNMPGHYRSVASYGGPYAVVHNTLPTGEASVRPPLLPFNGTWVIGWFGSLRCERSLEILCRVAKVAGPHLKILAAGTQKFPPGIFERATAGLANLSYLGPFDARNDVAALYAQAHFSYAAHYEPEEKAKWALPVRILEGGAYGRPSLTRADADMGRYVRAHDIGWALDDLEKDLPALLESLTAAEYERVAQNVARQRSLFIGERDLAAALAAVRRASGHRP